MSEAVGRDIAPGNRQKSEDDSNKDGSATPKVSTKSPVHLGEVESQQDANESEMSPPPGATDNEDNTGPHAGSLKHDEQHSVGDSVHVSPNTNKSHNLGDNEMKTGFPSSSSIYFPVHTSGEAEVDVSPSNYDPTVSTKNPKATREPYNSLEHNRRPPMRIAGTSNQAPTSNLKQDREEAARLFEENKDLHSKIKQLEEDKTQSQHDFQLKIQTLQGRLKGLEKELTAAKDNRNKLQDAHKNRENYIESMLKELDSMSSRNKALGSENGELRTKLGGLEASEHDCRVSLDHRTDQLQKLQEEHDKLHRLHDILQSELKDEKKVNKDTGDAIDAIKSKMESDRKKYELEIKALQWQLKNSLRNSPGVAPPMAPSPFVGKGGEDPNAVQEQLDELKAVAKQRGEEIAHLKIQLEASELRLKDSKHAEQRIDRYHKGVSKGTKVSSEWDLEEKLRKPLSEKISDLFSLLKNASIKATTLEGLVEYNLMSFVDELDSSQVLTSTQKENLRGIRQKCQSVIENRLDMPVSKASIQTNGLRTDQDGNRDNLKQGEDEATTEIQTLKNNVTKYKEQIANLKRDVHANSFASLKLHIVRKELDALKNRDIELKAVMDKISETVENTERSTLAPLPMKVTSDVSVVRGKMCSPEHTTSLGLLNNIRLSLQDNLGRFLTWRSGKVMFPSLASLQKGSLKVALTSQNNTEAKPMHTTTDGFLAVHRPIPPASAYAWGMRDYMRYVDRDTQNSALEERPAPSYEEFTQQSTDSDEIFHVDPYESLHDQLSPAQSSTVPVETPSIYKWPSIRPSILFQSRQRAIGKYGLLWASLAALILTFAIIVSQADRERRKWLAANESASALYWSAAEYDGGFFSQSFRVLVEFLQSVTGVEPIRTHYG